MKAEGCREWQQSLGPYALGGLPEDERAGLEAHLQGCPACREDLESLKSVASLLPLADPASFESTPMPEPALGRRIADAIGAESRQQRRRRRRRGGLAVGGALAAAAVALVLFVLPGGGGTSPERHVEFGALPGKLEISAKMIPHAFGTEIHVYVKGAPSGALCRVFVRGRNGTRLPAGSFRYRWGDDSLAILSSALDLSRTAALGVRVGDRTFVAPVSTEQASTAATSNEEAKT